MQRRQFLKSTLITSAGVVSIPYFNKILGATAVKGTYAELFLNPPANAKPWVYWMWMNGNITKEGITLDLEAMKRMGIGGFLNFNAAVGIPRGPVDYAGAAWTDAVYHSASEAHRLELNMFIHNSPGYSGCGGPWITPEYSMQQLVWTEAFVNNTNGAVNIKLEKPYAKQNYYRDAFVLAYPSLPVEKALMKDKLVKALVNGKEIDKNIIIDGNPETKIRLEVTEGASAATNPAAYDFVNAPAPSATGGGRRSGGSGPANNSQPKNTLLLEFSEPFETRAICILRKPEIPRDLFDGPRDHPPTLILESSDDGTTFKEIGRITCVELRQMDTPSTLSYNAVTAKFYRLTTTSSTWLSEVQLQSGPRLGGWSGKTNNTHGNSRGETPATGQDLIIDPNQVVDISTNMDSQGNLKWNAPAGKWTILRIGHTTTGEIPAAHPDSAEGLEIDMYNRQALDQHFEKFLDPLFKKLSPYIGKSFKGITVDSWEAGKQNWTIKFPEEFEKARKYDLIQWMPAMTGRIVGSVDDTERFLWDVRKTHADLIAKNFYGYMQELCHKRGLKFSAEPYGDAVFDSLQVGQYLDIPMSEFWTRYIYGSDDTSKQAASVAHVYGHKVAAAESFTSMPANSKWKDYPYSLKAEGDYFFTLGINQLVFHTFVHQPYKTGKPGMTMGPFGSHFDRNNTWTEQAYGWTNYLKRTQYLLQQGLFVADACYFKGDEPASGTPDTYRLMPDGYVADVVGADGLSRFAIKEGQIVLPDGMNYKVCILARINEIVPETLNKLKKLVTDGMTLIVSNKPSKTFGRQQEDKITKNAIDELYSDLDGVKVKSHVYGKGKLIWTADYKQLFADMKIEPDFKYTGQNEDAAVFWMHKKTTAMQFYFISNHLREYEKIQCSFRITGLQPEIWNSETGKMYDQALYEFKDGRTHIALDMEPAESVFVVFRKKAAGNGYANILKGDKPYLSILPYTANVAPYATFQNNFTLTMWAKPDSFAQDSRSMLFHAPQGDVYGPGHGTMAIGAGQNGVHVYESTGGRERSVITDNQPVEGWTHIAVVYQNGKPSLYLNGKLRKTGAASNNIIHPGLLAPPSRSQYSTYFEGNYTTTQVVKEALTEQQVVGLFNKGLPVSEVPIDLKLKQLSAGHLEAEVFKNGTYNIKSANSTKQINVNNCESAVIKGAWNVTFSDGTPAIELPELISLHRHSDFDVKHFSGTATYRKSITVPASYISLNKKIYLDLGRVEVIAELKINGKKAGILWKEPYSLDITGDVKVGDNNLEISVTTLWPNRLIGDEHLPEENVYSVNNFVEKLPDWYVKNEPKSGKRKTFTTWKNFDKDSPLVESGLLGPVVLRVSVKKIII